MVSFILPGVIEKLPFINQNVKGTWGRHLGAQLGPGALPALTG